jgi:hypothetical protein
LFEDVQILLAFQQQGKVREQEQIVLDDRVIVFAGDFAGINPAEAGQNFVDEGGFVRPQVPFDVAEDILIFAIFFKTEGLNANRLQHLNQRLFREFAAFRLSFGFFVQGALQDGPELIQFLRRIRGKLIVGDCGDEFADFFGPLAQDDKGRIQFSEHIGNDIEFLQEARLFVGDDFFVIEQRLLIMHNGGIGGFG